MYNELQKKWLAALKSGEYKQGKDYLCKGDKHCCLGVAYKLIHDLPKDKSIKRTCGSRHAAALPTVDMQTLNLYSSLGAKKGSLDHSLSAFNDMGTPFTEIADIIEANPQDYFTNFES